MCVCVCVYVYTFSDCTTSRRVQYVWVRSIYGSVQLMEVFELTGSAASRVESKSDVCW